MGWFKRIFLFLAINFLVVMTISLVVNFLGLQPYLTRQGINYESLAIFCLIWGFGGAFISLALSRVMARWMMGVRIVDPNTREPQLRELVEMVHRLSRSAGLSTMPQVGYYDSPEINAFATGPTRNRSLVAVSTGLMSGMQKAEVEGVIGHEIAHIANGDMVTMTLIQGVVNAFVMFLARIIAFAVANMLRGRDDNGGAALSHGVQYLLVFVLEIIFMVLGSIVVAAYSRWREFHADAGGARLAGRDKMIAALRALQNNLAVRNPHAAEQASMQAFKISSGRGSRWLRLFSTHPPLEVRIQRLERLA